MAFILQAGTFTMEEMLAGAGAPLIMVPRGETAKASFAAFQRTVQQASGTPGCSVILEPIGLVLVDGSGGRVETPGGCCVLWHSNEPDVMFCHNHITNKMGMKALGADLTRARFAFLDVSATPAVIEFPNEPVNPTSQWAGVEFPNEPANPTSQ